MCHATRMGRADRIFHVTSVWGALSFRSRVYDPCSHLQSILVFPLVSWALRKWGFGHGYVWPTGFTTLRQATSVKVSLLSRQ